MARAHAMALAQRGDLAGAVAVCEEHLATNPNDSAMLAVAGEASLNMGLADKAVMFLRRATRLDKRSPDLLQALGLALLRDRKLNEAHAAVDKALRLDPQHAVSLSLKAELHRLRGEYEQAYAVLAPALESGTPDLAVLTALARIAPRVGRDEQAAAMLQQAAGDASVPQHIRQIALFALGGLLDKARRYDEAFEVYQRANRLAAVPYDPAAFKNTVDRLIEHWTRDAIAALPRPAEPSDKPVFVLGMPRSGTSLVEQVLSCHRDVFAEGELDDLTKIVWGLCGEKAEPFGVMHEPNVLTADAVEASAKRYLDRITAHAPSASRITDKEPFNFLHIGLISALFPGARIIHCRRSPADTCLSAYFTHFANFPFPTELADLGAYYNQYLRLMEHWKTAVDVPILDVVYEDVVADLETQSRRIIEHVGLDWDEACLRFHESRRVTFTPSNEQVRQPIYTSSIGRYRNYDRHLGPLLDALG
jgi:tetratricopeptide (TPR) repeat protein